MNICANSREPLRFRDDVSSSSLSLLFSILNLINLELMGAISDATIVLLISLLQI